MDSFHTGLKPEKYNHLLDVNHYGAFGTAEVNMNVDHIRILGDTSVLALQVGKENKDVIGKKSKEMKERQKE